jgi:heme/copper-type cytochrome/quinol oxidase subunit 2
VEAESESERRLRAASEAGELRERELQAKLSAALSDATAAAADEMVLLVVAVLFLLVILIIILLLLICIRIMRAADDEMVFINSIYK